jgi:hypothetical protein
MASKQGNQWATLRDSVRAISRGTRPARAILAGKDGTRDHMGATVTHRSVCAATGGVHILAILGDVKA